MVNDAKGKGKAPIKEEEQEIPKPVEDYNLEQGISNLEALFANLKKKQMQQNEGASSEDDDSSEDSGDNLIKFLSEHDLQWQFSNQAEEPRHEGVKTENEEAKPKGVKTEEVKLEEVKTEEEDLIPLDIIYPLEEIYWYDVADEGSSNAGNQ